MPFRLKPKPVENPAGRDLELGMPSPSLFRRSNALCTCFLIVFVACMLSSSCVSVLSARKAKISAQDAPTGGLIKPTLQDQGAVDSPGVSENKTNVSPAPQTKQKTVNREGGLWNRLLGVCSGSKLSTSNAPPSGLIKPKLSEGAENGPDSMKQTADSPPRIASEKGVRAPKASPDGDESLAGALDSKSEESEIPKKGSHDEAVSPDSKKASKLSDDPPVESQGDSVNEKKPKGDKEQSDLEPTETTFKKHDHAKYVTMIRNKAIDTLNKEAPCDVARLCRDSFTDTWSLTLYAKSGKFYVYTVYAWDEIDGNWIPSYTSEKRPVATMKKHLDFTSAGKKCQMLKGSGQAESF